MKQLLLFGFLLCSVHSSAQEKQTVYFDRNSAEVSDSSISKLIDWMQTLPDSVKKLDVIGYADFLASEYYNLALSEQRAKAVLKLIEVKATFKYGMSMTSALGEARSKPNGSAEGIPADRKVEILVILYSTESSNIDQLAELAAGETLVLDNLNFYGGQHYLLPQAEPEMNRLIEVMKANPQLEIEIQGHICCQLDSTDGYDRHTRTYTLSSNRAQYIFERLVDEGIEATRMTYKGFAGTRPLVYPEKTADDRTKNRRVEIKVIKN